MISKQSLIALSTTVIVLSTIGTTLVRADDCVTQYGGSQYGTNCNPNELVINKEVQKIGSKGSDGGAVYVENLSTSDTLATAGSFMTFRLTVKNNSNHDFSSVEVKDIFPPYMSYPVNSTNGILANISGGDVKSATYDPGTKNLTMRLENVKAGESRQIIITGQVDGNGNFPAGQSTFCVVNTAQVRGDNSYDDDTAQICISNNKSGTSNLPKAGFDSYLTMIPFAFLGVFGIKLAKKRAA